MRMLFLTLLCIISNACSNNGDSSHHRSYVISKSTETAKEVEILLEEEADFIEPSSEE